MGKTSKNQKLQKGFTFIELLVVIAVIAILILIAVVTLAPGKAKTRDAKRITEVNTIRKAIQVYYLDHGKYPEQEETWCSIESDCTNLVNEIAPYLPEIPQDPLYGKGKEPEEKLYSYQYITTDGGQEYKIYSDLETRKDPYEVYSIGGSVIAYVPPGGGNGGGGASPKLIIAIGGTGADYGVSADQTSDGGYVVTGWTFSYDVGGGDALLVKLDDQNSVSWATVVGGGSLDEPNFVKQTSDGGYIIAGYTNSFGAGSYDFFIVKFNSDGSYGWSRAIGGTASDRAWSVQETSDGGYIVAGYTSSFGAGSSDFFLVKLTSAGNLDWAKTVGGGSGDGGYEVQETSDGGYIVAGSTDSFSAGERDFFLVKFDSSGNYQWSTAVGGSGWESGRSVQQTSDGGYIMAGETEYGAGMADFFLVKFDSAGTYEWSRAVGGTNEEQAYGVLEASDGGYIINGFSCSFGYGNCDFFLVKFQSDGTYEWAKTVGGSNFDYSWKASKRFGDGGFLMSGYTGSWGAGGTDFLLVRFDSAGDTCAQQQSVSPTVTSPSPTVTTPTPTVTTPTPTVTTPTPTVTSPSPTETTVCPE